MPPLPGTIMAWSANDCVGRIQLTSGEWLRFGATVCKFLPALGLAVEVHGTAPHPLGGLRATSVLLVDPGDADRVRDDCVPLPGASGTPAELAAFVELTDAVGLLGIVLREPLRSRAALRAWFARAGVEVEYSNASDVHVRRAGGPRYRVYTCMAPVADGEGVVSFAFPTPFSVATERELALAGATLGHARVDVHPACADLASLVDACAADELDVIAHQARGYLAPVDAWRQARVATADGLGAWVRVMAGPGRDPVLTGMAALGLPDLFARGVAPAEVEGVLREAASALVVLGRRPAVGEGLGRAIVVSADDEFVQIAPR